ncbi:hepatocyte nuclear factor 4 alpha [Homo sapiens]|uniref:Hepatocyte nuclear factor 4 alpha n=1 Tax=Homo sapiens TaxID=9606 RepID=F8WBS7_HUMAN|nr:hepatocyte nuclear factor 4 alpha [Homo sapiens]KAI4005639.1 hepatocyte nuclear factor 4 alpha [Homo sapiens]
MRLSKTLVDMDMADYSAALDPAYTTLEFENVQVLTMGNDFVAAASRQIEASPPTSLEHIWRGGQFSTGRHVPIRRHQPQRAQQPGCQRPVCHLRGPGHGQTLRCLEL